MEVSVHEAKDTLAELLEKVALGEEVIIAQAGKPVAKLIALEKAPKRQLPHTALGAITLKPGWNDPLTLDELAEFGS